MSQTNLKLLSQKQNLRLMTKETTNPAEFNKKILSFKDDVLKMKRDYREGRIFEVGDLILEDADPDNIIEMSCVKDIPDVSFFSLGAVYVTAKVPYSLLDQYCGEINQEQFLTIQTPSFAEGLDVLEDGVIVGTWNDKIHAMDKEKIELFSEFLCTQVLCDPDGKLFGVRFTDAMIQDPVLRDRKGIRDENLMRIRLFTPYTIKGDVVPIIGASGIVSFNVQPSSPDLKANLRPSLIAQKDGLKQD